jgi:hypothetical protein
MPSLAHQHCLNHDAREAVAQCPACRNFFCRECVTEHDGRLLCAACVRKMSNVVVSGRRPWRALARLGLSVAGCWTAMLFFYWLGQLLLLIPTQYHDGTLWQSLGDGNP